MKTFEFLSHREASSAACRGFRGCRAALLVVLAGAGWGGAIGRAQAPGGDGPGVQVLTRGPVHEAFAGTVTFNPAPGVVVPQAPPDRIEELPPAERPEGDNVAWIPGYWAWDDERNGFLWISGTWRALPPGREWMAGYWGQTSQGHQWISGYWADATARETTYLPPPPATVEGGPNVAAPSVDYGWTPGCWIWYQGRYAWQPGYWAQGQADWDWIPAQYVWTPRGYIFVEGYWDYPVERRGVLFAPIYFEPGVYSRRGYSYSPTIAIDLAVFFDHLFLRPSTHHYYFGDYYAANYAQRGYYASVSFSSSRYGYDPFYSRQRWEHRRDREWEQRVTTAYQYRRDHEAARPPRTWAAQTRIDVRTTAAVQNRMAVAAPIAQLARGKESPLRFQPVAREERQQLARRGQEVQQSRDQRRTLEARVVAPAPRQPGVVFEPAKVQLPRSPIVARPANQSGRNQPPPRAPQAPKPDLKVRPESELPARQASLAESNPPPERRQPESARKSAPARGKAAVRERQAQPESEQRAKAAAVKAREEALRKAKTREGQPQVEPEPPATEEPAPGEKGPAPPGKKGLEKGKGKP